MSGSPRHLVRRVTRHAGITKQVSPHTLWDAFITAAFYVGFPPRDVQEAAWQADPTHRHALRPHSDQSRPAKQYDN